MLRHHSYPDSNIVELTIDGAITRDDFDDVIRELNSKIDEFGSVDVLEEIRRIGTMPPAVLFADLKWAAGHWRKIGRAAVVCDKAWIEKMIDVLQPVTRADIRHFELDEIDDARRWLRDSLDQGPDS